MDMSEKDAPQKCGAEHGTMLKPLRIELKFRGFEKNSIAEIIEITRGKDSETFVAPPVQQDMRRGRYGKMSLAVRFFTEEEPKFFPVFVPADPSGDTYQPSIDVLSDDRYGLTLHEGQEGVVVVTEKYGEKFQITFLDLWEPAWISSCFGDRDTIMQHFGLRNREYILNTVMAIEYRIAEEQAEKQRAVEEQERKKQCTKEEQRVQEEQRTKEAKERVVDAEKFLERLGLGRKKEE